MKAFFLPLRQGNRFCILHDPPPAAPRRGAVLFIHPFAEEMNQSRRMAALQSRACADAGWTTLQIDLYGCGDSDGDLAEARWEDWIGDVTDASGWLRERTAAAPVLWGLRAGCLLAAQVARASQPGGLVMWQPVLSGKQHLRQFLRLKAVSERIGGGETAVDTVRDELERGRTVEIAGYPLNPGLAAALNAADLEPPAEPSRIAWLEVQARGAALSSPSRARIEAFERAGHAVCARAVDGAPFWQIAGSRDAPALIDATLAAMQEWH